MKENDLTTALLRTRGIVEEVRQRIAQKAGTPIMQQKIPRSEMRQRYETLTPEIVQGLVQKYGPGAVADYLKREIELERRRNG